MVIGVGVLLFPGVGFRLLALICERSGCVSSATLRTHDDNMAKAEAFRQAMLRDLPSGAPFDDVLGYLHAHNLHFGLVGLSDPQDQPPRDGRGDLYVEMFREKSPQWYCGSGSVGLTLFFVDGRLNQTRATYWSSDCP